MLVHQTYGKRKWGLPGGAEETGESAWQIAIRECKEEINVDIALSQLILSGMYFLSHRNAYAYVFKVSSYSGVPAPDRNEIDEIKYFSLDNLPSPMSNFTVQRIMDAAANHSKVILREQHVSTYVIGEPKNFEPEKV